MGLLSWVFGGSKPHFRIEGWLIDGITLAEPVRTPLGGRVRCIGCVVDLDYRVRGGAFEVTSVRLGQSSLSGMAVNVNASRRGEAWKADGALRRHLDDKILPQMMAGLASDPRLQKEMRKHAGLTVEAGATAKQTAYAKGLGIKFDEGIGKSAISALIDDKLARRK